MFGPAPLDQPVNRGTAWRLGLAAAQTLKLRVTRRWLPALSVIRIESLWCPDLSGGVPILSDSFRLVVLLIRFPSSVTAMLAIPAASLARIRKRNAFATHARGRPATVTSGGVVFFTP